MSESLTSIFKDRLVEVWVDEFTRALIIPLRSGVNILSIDLYFKFWRFPIDEEVEVEDSKLVYHVPKELPSSLKRFKVYKLEFIGHIRGDYKETISVRVWSSKSNIEEREVTEIYKLIVEEYFKENVEDGSWQNYR